MAKFTYKNVTAQDIMIPNVGVVKAGDTITTVFELSNVNLELVTEPVTTSKSQARRETAMKEDK
jgi:hypothetical protein